MASTDSPVLTPSQLNRLVRTLLESHFDFVWLEGEISNLARPSSGHWYFTLKDEGAQVRCAMFRNSNQRLRFRPENGDQVRLRARVSLYEGRGEFQLIAEFMEAAGAGALQAQFDALRDRLRAEGLFDSARKRPLPATVRHLAVITSPTGAALQDILHVLERRNPAIRISVFPTAVQGAQAPAELCTAVDKANALFATGEPQWDFDAIILARGGGSLEDLWAFNDEALARRIADSALPLVSGVGHEVDFTIADFAADARAPTPSAAAELLSTDRGEVLAGLARQEQRLGQAVRRRLERAALTLAAARAGLRHPGDRLRERAQRLDTLELRLRGAMDAHLLARGRDLERLTQRATVLSPAGRIERLGEALAQQQLNLARSMRLTANNQRQRLERMGERLESLNPLAVLGRGYAIVTDAQGRALREAAAVTVGDTLGVRLSSGRLTVGVRDKEETAEAKGGR